MPTYSWNTDQGPWSAAESGNMEEILEQWTSRLQSQFPKRASHLVWDREGVRLLEEAVDSVVAEDNTCPPHLVAFYRRSLINRLTGLGPLDPLLQDDSITEIMVNGSSAYVERYGRLEECSVPFLNIEEVQDLARRIANRAGRELNSENPLCDAQLSDGSRIHCVLPPVSEVPCITIRRVQATPLSLADYLAQGALSEALWEDLAHAVTDRKNIIVAGGASTGKTSLLRLLTTCIPEEERLVTIEDVRELNISHANTVRLEAYGPFTVTRLVANALRMRPDRIIVGEVRGSEALDLLEAMNSGHPGSLCSIHSSGGDMRTVHRLARLALQKAPGLSFESLCDQIVQTIDWMIYLQRDSNGRRYVNRVVEVSEEGFRTRWYWDGQTFVERVGT